MPSRRSFVASAVAGGVASLAGCTGDDDGGVDSAGSTTRASATAVTSTGFEWKTPGGSDHSPDDEPSVTFDDPNGVTVVGALWYGSSSCDRIALDDVSLDGGALRVRVVATSVRDEPDVCTDDLAAADYRVSVTLDGGLPERVAVTEVPARGDSRTYTSTPD